MNWIENDWFTPMYKRVFDIESSKIAKIGSRYLCTINIEPPECDPRKECAVFVRDPGATTENELEDPFGALCAFKLCDPSVQSSLILVQGEYEREVFREFEKKFMQKNENLLPIYDITLLKHLKEMAKVQFEKKMSIRSIKRFESCVTSHAVPKTPIATVPKTHRERMAELRSIEKTIDSALSTEPPKLTIPPVTVPSAPKPSSPRISRGHSVTIDTPVIPPLPELPVAAVPRRPTVSVAPYPMTRKTPVVTVPTTIHEIMDELDRKGKLFDETARRLDEMEDAPLELFISVYKEFQDIFEDQEVLVAGLKRLVEETNSQDQRWKRYLMVEIVEMTKDFREMREVNLRNFNERVAREAAAVPQAATVPVVATVSINTPATTRSTVAEPLMLRQQPVKLKKVKMRQTTYTVEERWIPVEKVKEKKSRRAERKKKEWKTAFTPFHEEMGKAIEELIRRMKEFC